MDKPKVLYRGAQEKLDVLTPAPILETEKHRFPPGTESVVFASAYKQEALAYAIASRRNLSGFNLTPYLKDETKKEIGWKLTLDCSEKDVPKDTKTNIYELSSENFELNKTKEWFSTKNEVPITSSEISLGEALKEFDEVHFSIDEMRIKGEGTNKTLV